jgi:ribosome recycling factor
VPSDDILLEAEDKMQKAVEHLKAQFRTVRTGRASAGLVEHIRIDYYGMTRVRLATSPRASRRRTWASRPRSMAR